MALWLCGSAVPFAGHEAAATGAVTVCVVTGLQTDLTGWEARKKGAQRLLGTLAGIGCASVFGSSWQCMALWGAAMTVLRQGTDASWTYSCLVAALTYAIVALGGGPGSVVSIRAYKRFSGVAVGVVAVCIALLLRFGFTKAWRAGTGYWKDVSKGPPFSVCVPVKSGTVRE